MMVPNSKWLRDNQMTGTVFFFLKCKPDDMIIACIAQVTEFKIIIIMMVAVTRT